MQKVFSKLENNIFENIEIKKGENLISDNHYLIIKKNPIFKNYVNKGFIIVQEVKAATFKNAEVQDFDKMTYQELKQFAYENKIIATSNKKDDLLKAIKEFNN